MSDQQAQGSIILKILILITAIILVSVIIIPGQIWEKEEMSKSITLSDIESVYEAHRYYYKLNQKYTISMDTLLTTVRNDSSLKIKKRIVDYTTNLNSVIGDFLSEPVVKSLVKVSQNVKSIETDFESNELYFKKYDDIFAKSEDLKFKVAVLKEGVEQEDYAIVAKSLDSLLNLHRDLQDYQLQVAARRAHTLTTSIVNKLSGIDFQAMINYWEPLNLEMTELMLQVNSTDLKTRTSVADRVEDFQQQISSGFRTLKTGDKQKKIEDAKNSTEKVKSVYENFLSDFLTTEKYVQYQLSDSDERLLNLNEQNFITPINDLPYVTQFMDTLGLIVEDPTLSDEIKEKAMSPVNSITNLPFMKNYETYIATLDSIDSFSKEIKNKYRRNAEVHFKSKDISAVISELKNSSTLISYQDIEKLVSKLPSSNSFSEMKTMIEGGLLGMGVFKQISENKVYGKLDSVHLDLIHEMQGFNELISEIRNNEYTFDPLIAKLESDLSQIKSSSSGANLTAQLNDIIPEMQNLFLFSSDGMEESVYGIFTTKIMNHGKMYGRTGEKSWEEEE